MGNEDLLRNFIQWVFERLDTIDPEAIFQDQDYGDAIVLQFLDEMGL